MKKRVGAGTSRKKPMVSKNRVKKAAVKLQSHGRFIKQLKDFYKGLRGKKEKNIFRMDLSNLIKEIGGVVEDQLTLTKSKSFYTPQDLADVLGVSKPYIHSMIKKGIIKTLPNKTSGHKRISSTEFKKFKDDFLGSSKILTSMVESSVKDFGDSYFDDMPKEMK